MADLNSKQKKQMEWHYISSMRALQKRAKVFCFVSMNEFEIKSNKMVDCYSILFGCLTLAPSDLSIYALFFHCRMFAFAGSTRTRTSDVHLPCMQTEKLDRNDKQRRSTHRRKRQQNQMHMCDCAFALSVSAFARICHVAVWFLFN